VVRVGPDQANGIRAALEAAVVRVGPDIDPDARAAREAAVVRVGPEMDLDAQAALEAAVVRSGLADIAHHISQRNSNPSLLDQTTPYDVASNFRQALSFGWVRTQFLSRSRTRERLSTPIKWGNWRC
jgi:hypothetical protein